MERSPLHRLFRRSLCERMLSAPHRPHALLGVPAAVFLAAIAVIVLPAAGSAATGITITSGPCSDGGTSFCFDPEIATAAAGTAVTWTDESGVAHEIEQCTPSACPGAPASTGSNTFNVVVPADGHGSFTFSSTGTYYYYCSIHGYAAMHGTLVITIAATSPPSPSATPKPTARSTALPTHAPVMQSAKTLPTRTPSAPATSAGETTPTVTATPDNVQAIGGNPFTPTPSPHATIALVKQGGGPTVPVALVIALLACVGVAAFVSLRRRGRQAG